MKMLKKDKSDNSVIYEVQPLPLEQIALKDFDMTSSLLIEIFIESFEVAFFKVAFSRLHIMHMYVHMYVHKQYTDKSNQMTDYILREINIYICIPLTVELVENRLDKRVGVIFVQFLRFLRTETHLLWDHFLAFPLHIGTTLVQHNNYHCAIFNRKKRERYETCCDTCQ
jgi:hypothetical protein